MPARYLKIRNEMFDDCEGGKHPGKQPNETCLDYAKRMASIIYYKQTGKTPEEAEHEVDLIERVEELLRLRANEHN